jgi:hypothetical protein
MSSAGGGGPSSIFGAPAHAAGIDANRWIADDLASLRQKVPNHTPPVYDHNGLERNTKKIIEQQRINRLDGVSMPAQWSISPRFGTRTELRRTRAAEMRPHASFDVDGDGFVGPTDYSIAKKHDLGSGGMLTGGQRDSAIAETCYRVGSKLQDCEIGGNAKARRVLSSLREDPVLGQAPADLLRREQRLRVGGMHVASLKMKSSQQLKDCLRFPEPYVPPANEPGPTYTRSMLLQRRREENAAANDAGRETFMRTYGLGFP